MQAERVAKADVAYARFAAERATLDKNQQENALARAARAAQLKAEREKYRKKMALAAAAAPKVYVRQSVAQLVW